MVMSMIPEEEFRDVLKRHFTPSRSISSTQYLRGRAAQLRQIDRAFNSEGKHTFIHGDRGVGKTSLGRTAAFVHGSADGDPPIIACEKGNSAYQLLRDIALCCIPPRHLADAAVKKKTFKAGLPFLSADVTEEIKRGQVPQITSVNEALAIIGHLANLNQKDPVIVIDEFDVIEDEATRHTFASFIKHVSDQEIGVRFIICGIGDSLDEMIGSHLSTGRYLRPIPLERLSHDARWEIILSAAHELKVNIDENSCIRIGQISDGFPYYVHLMGEKLLWAMHDDEKPITISDSTHFDIALREASTEAEPSLKRAYDKATQKYTDYQQVLWAVADDSSLRRQTKDIFTSYVRIMQENYRDREPLDMTKFYARMNSLRTERHGCIIRTTGAGWYEFRENRLRGYVRLVAERSAVQLEPEHHLGERRTNLLLEWRKYTGNRT